MPDVLSNQRRLSPPALPSLDRLAAAAKRVHTKWPNVNAEPPARDREELVQKVLGKWKADDWSDTPLSLVTGAAWAVFDCDRRDRKDLEGLRKFYYRELRASDKRSFVDALFGVYLGTYDPNGPHTSALARALSANAVGLGDRHRRLLTALPELLDPENGAYAIAGRMASMADPWSDLKVAGMEAPHAPGVMDHAHLAYLDLMRPRLHERAAAETLLGWLKPEGREARASGAAEAIAALLEPWREKEPPDDHKRLLTENLVRLYRDPRVERGGAWARVPPALLNRFLHWLTGESIRFFLDVVSAVEDSHMWEPRRRFWLGLFERNHPPRIEAACVAFSDAGAREARRRMTSLGSRSTLPFGVQTAGGNDRDKSLLVMRIGSKIIIEGSHNFKVYIFDEGSRGAPTLHYQGEYDCGRIRKLPGSRSKMHLGDWQRWVLENI